MTPLIGTFALACLATIVAAQAPIDTALLRRDLSVLAADSMGGRAPGSAGHARAAAYIVRQLRAIGTAGMGPGGAYLTPVPLQRVAVAPDAALRLSGHATTHSLGLDDFHLMGRTARAFRGFAGNVRQLGDARAAAVALTAVTTLRGEVAVLTVGGGPLEPILQRLFELGAEGAVALAADSAMYARLRGARGFTRYVLAPEASRGKRVGTPVPTDAAGSLPLAVVGPAGTAKFREFLARSSSGAPLDIVLSARVQFHPVNAANIVARLPGSASARQDSAVVFVAHYDHVGAAERPATDTIYNGFVDNATGVASLLAIARAIRARPLPHDAVFLFTTAEEEGSLGSQHLLATDSGFRARTRLAINVDHPPPLAVPRSWLIEAKDERAVRAANAAVATLGTSAEIAPPQPTSDHWSFVARDLPAVFLVPGEGWQGLTQADEERLIARWWRPHRVDDEYAPDFPIAGLAAMAELALRIGAAVR